MRSDTTLNVKNLPSKSTLKKDKKIAYSTTPIRIGEMEVTNLMLTKRGDMVEKLLKSYATNEDARQKTVLQLLNPGVDNLGHTLDPLNMDLDIDLSEKSISREILEKDLSVLGYTLVDTVDKNSEKSEEIPTDDSSKKN